MGTVSPRQRTNKPEFDTNRDIGPRRATAAGVGSRTVTVGATGTRSVPKREPRRETHIPGLRADVGRPSRTPRPGGIFGKGAACGPVSPTISTSAAPLPSSGRPPSRWPLLTIDGPQNPVRIPTFPARQPLLSMRHGSCAPLQSPTNGTPSVRTNEPNWTKIWTDTAGSPGDERHGRRDGHRQFQAGPRLRSASAVNDPGPAPHRLKSHLTRGSLAAPGVPSGPPNCRIEPVTLDFLRTVCGLGEVTPR